jgi:hypothetical protein
MELLYLGVAVYMMGHGARGIANAGLAGSIAMIVGGILVLVAALT